MFLRVTCPLAIATTIAICGCSSSSSSSNTANDPLLEIPGTPTHSVPQAQCQTDIDAETKACGDAGGVPMSLGACLNAQTYDAEGCLSAWLAYLNCRAHAAIDCSTGDSTCDTAPSYFACQSQFVRNTGGSALGERPDTCGTGKYMYGCLNGVAPFSNYQSVQTGAAVPYFCCG